MFEKMAPDAHLSYANDNVLSSKFTNPIEINNSYQKKQQLIKTYFTKINFNSGKQRRKKYFTKINFNRVGNSVYISSYYTRFRSQTMSAWTFSYLDFQFLLITSILIRIRN